MAGRNTKMALVALLALGVLGCTNGGSREDTFRNAVPRSETLTMAVPGGGLGSEEGGARAALIGETAVLYGHTRHAIDGVNLYVHTLGSILDAVFSTEPVWRDAHTAVFGPFGDTLEPAVFAVVVSSEDDVRFNYVIIGKPRLAGDDAFVPVLAGTSENGPDGETQRGALVIDGSQLNALDPIRNPSRTTVSIEYDTAARPVGLHVAALDADAPADGIEAHAIDYRYVRNEDGSGAVLLGSHGGLDEAGAAAPDFWLGTMWNALGEGRSDFAASGGGEGDAVHGAVECWDVRFARTYFADSSGASEGAAETCRFSASIFDVIAMASGGAT